LTSNGTVLSIHAEDRDFRALQEEFRDKGGEGLTGTSANKAGDQTHFRTHEVYEDFKERVPMVVAADYTRLDPLRNRSSTLLRFEGDIPVLHREGNVSRHELNQGLMDHGFPDLQICTDVRRVIGRP